MKNQKDKTLEDMLANEWVIRLETERYLYLRKGDYEIFYNINEQRVVSLYPHDR